MATKFSSKKASEMLLQAADLVDSAMVWSSTPEGGDYWATVKCRLENRAKEARGEKVKEEPLEASVVESTGSALEDNLMTLECKLEEESSE